MGLFEGVLGGLANAAGATGVTDKIAERKKNRKNLSDQELQFETNRILNDVDTAHKRKAALDPNGPNYAQESAQIDKDLHDLMGDFRGMLHPDNNPTALSQLGGILKSRIGGKKHPVSTPADARKAMEGGLEGIESRLYSPQAKVNPYIEKTGQLTAAGVPKDDALRIATGQKEPGENWKWNTIALADGRTMTVQHNTKDNSIMDLNGQPISPELLAGATLTSKTGGAAQTNLEAYESAFDPPVKWAQMTPQQRAFYPSWKAQQTQAITTGQHVMLVPQPDNSIKTITVQDTRQKTVPGGAPAPQGLRQSAPPATPGEAKARVPRPQAGVVAQGSTVGGRMLPAVSSAQKEVTAAVGLASLADQVAQKPNDAINQKRLAVALERVSAGRFTTQALDYIIKAGWGNTLEQWANNPTTGALPTDVLRQLVDGAHQNLQAKKDALAAAQGMGGGGGGQETKTYQGHTYTKQPDGSWKLTQ